MSASVTHAIQPQSKHAHNENHAATMSAATCQPDTYAPDPSVGDSSSRCARYVCQSKDCAAIVGRIVIGSGGIKSASRGSVEWAGQRAKRPSKLGRDVSAPQ